MTVSTTCVSFFAGVVAGCAITYYILGYTLFILSKTHNDMIHRIAKMDSQLTHLR